MDEQRNQEFQDQEYERYGVWVKAGPEDVLEDAEDNTTSIQDLGDLGDLDDFGDTEDLELPETVSRNDTVDDDDLDIDDLDDDDGIVSMDDLDDDLDLDLEEDDGLVSLDDLDIEEPAEETDPFAALGADAGPDEVDDELARDTFDLESLSDSLDDDYETLEIDDNGAEQVVETLPGSDDEIEEISLEQIDSDLDVNLDEHDFTPDEQGIEIEAETPRNTLTPDEEEFLREDDEESHPATADLQNPPESAIPSSMDFQEREAFERIQNELSDIKRELAELKEVLRGTPTVPREEIPREPSRDVETPPVSETPELADDQTDSTPATGFFEDEEDETIALTGDELDNILNTAEFTEEVGEAEELDDDFTLSEEEPFEQDEPDLDETDLDETDLDETDLDETDLDETDLDELDLDASPADTLSVEDDQEEETEEPTLELELEESESDAPFILDGDDSAVDELADMDIDQELADIESLQDDTEIETEDDLDEIELDLDALDDVPEGVSEELTATTEQGAVDELSSDDETAVDDDLGFESDELPEDELELESDDELTDDELELESDDELELESEDELELESDDELTEDELELEPESELPEDELEDEIEIEPLNEEQMESTTVDTVPEEDELELELDDLDELDVTIDDLEGEASDDEGFEDFAAAVEQDLEPTEEETFEDEEIVLDEEPEDLDLDLDLDVEEAQQEAHHDVQETTEADDHIEFDLEIEADEPQKVEVPETAPTKRTTLADLPEDLKQEIRSVLSYMDQLLEALPDDKIEEFAQSEHFEVYKHLFEELGLET